MIRLLLVHCSTSTFTSSFARLSSDTFFKSSVINIIVVITIVTHYIAITTTFEKVFNYRHSSIIQL